MLIDRHTHNSTRDSNHHRSEAIKKLHTNKLNKCVFVIRYHFGRTRVNWIDGTWNRYNSLLMSSTWSVGARRHWSMCIFTHRKKNSATKKRRRWSRCSDNNSNSAKKMVWILSITWCCPVKSSSFLSCKIMKGARIIGLWIELCLKHRGLEKLRQSVYIKHTIFFSYRALISML